MENQIGIYRIVSPSGKCYVGMTMTGFEWRWRGHLKELRNGRHKCAGLKRGYTKYGEQALKFEILEVVSPGTSEAIVLLKEQEWWDKLSARGVKLYNGRPTGTGSVFHTEESKAKLSATIESAFLMKYGLTPEDITRDSRGRRLVLKKCARKACSIPFSGAPTQKFCSKPCANHGSKIEQNTGHSLDEVLKLRSEGMSLRQIASKIGTSHESVRRALKNLAV